MSKAITYTMREEDIRELLQFIESSKIDRNKFNFCTREIQEAYNDSKTQFHQFFKSLITPPVVK